MKRIFGVLLAMALLTGALFGCAKAPEGTFTADDDIVTYSRIDPAKTQIVVSRTGNIEVQKFCAAFEKRNPDVQIVYIDITGGNAHYKPLTDWIRAGYVPDIMFSTANLLDNDTVLAGLMNLSANPIIENYEASALKRTAVNYEVYLLPGPSNINAMMYNKTLFKRYGWEVPTTFDEFVTLCDRISADTDGEIEPWNPNAKYDQELLTALAGFTYEELFGGVENRTWYNDFCAGKATFAGHMEPYMEVIKTLADHNILREEHFSYSATTRGKEFADGKIAMINMSIFEADNDAFDFGYMPYPTTMGEIGYVCDSYSCFVGVPIKEHTEKEQTAIDRFLSFFSSQEGQQIYIDGALKVSNVKGVSLNQTDDLAALQPTIAEGHMFAAINFENTADGRSNVNIYGYAIDIVRGDKTPEECIAEVDRCTENPAEEPEPEPAKIVASVERDMTILDTSFLMADMYRERAGADIGLITVNDPYRGNLMRLFAGEITVPMVTVLKPRSFENGSKLVKASMTGQQILDALDNPVGNEVTADCVYAYSGLQCVVAPWNALGEKYLSVKLADGKELNPNALYTVAFWAGTVADAYITETVETYEGTWEEHMIEKLTACGTIEPADDGRIKLIWN